MSLNSETKNGSLKKRIIKISVVAVILVVIVAALFKMVEYVDSGEVVVIQFPNGSREAYTSAGFRGQYLGEVRSYPKRFPFEFRKDPADSTKDERINTQFNDNAFGHFSGSVMVEMPLDSKHILEIDEYLRSREGIESGIIRPVMKKSIFMTGPLMSSRESIAEKKSELLLLIEDQAAHGVYRTKSMQVVAVDEITKASKTKVIVEILKDSKGQYLRAEPSPIARYGIRLTGLSIEDLGYDRSALIQMQAQANSTMLEQSAIVNARTAEQNAITAQKEGEAKVAKERAEQEVQKVIEVTAAEKRRDVAKLDMEAAEFTKRKEILEGEGIAQKKALVFKADGALQQKLDAWLKSQQYWATAFGAFQGNLVPLYQSGGNGQNNNAINYMEIMGMKAAKDLNLDLKNKN